jgi:TrmH family RNA methyltransferase
MITSSQNAKIKLARALAARSKDRKKAQSFIVEGVRLTEEAMQAGWQPLLVLYSQQLSSRGMQIIETFQENGIEVEEVAVNLLNSLSDTETSQGIYAVYQQKTLPLPDSLNFILIADQIRDPGNLGTLIRTAAAAGAQAVVTPTGTTDPFAPKVLRSAMGAHFRLPILEMDWPEIARQFKTNTQSPLRFLIAEAQGGSSCWMTRLDQPIALIIGGEADGAGRAARDYADGLVHIPMPGQSESLNAAVAGSILLFEVVRQRSQH